MLWSSSRTLSPVGTDRRAGRACVRSERLGLLRSFSVKIDLSESFSRLLKPPIAEAILDLRCGVGVEWHQERLKADWQAQLPDYPRVEPQRAFATHWRWEAGQRPEQQVADLDWTGLLFRSPDRPQVVQFQRNGFVFSRLAPYSGWDAFQTEALRLWRIYAEQTSPTAIQRIGLRFINRIACPCTGFHLEDYLHDSPVPVPSLALRRDAFLHQDTLGIPESDYSVNLVRTLQTAQATLDRIPLLLDLDVFTRAPVEPREENLCSRLGEMRWLKNKPFFGMITPKTMELFQ